MLLAILFAATAFFPRGQFHYGLERDDYLHRWYDRPLMQDSSYASANDPQHFINERGWRDTVKALRLGKMTGIGTFIDQARRDDLIARSVLPGAETTFLAEFDSVHSGEEPIGHVLRTAEKALSSPNAFRINGRVVMTEYGARTENEEQLGFYVKLRAALAEKFGPDRFYVLPYAPIVPIRNFVHTGDEISEDLKEKTRARIRMILRACDGFVWDGRESVHRRRFRGKVRDEIWTPIVRGVFDEPEFAGRRLGVLMRPGHENSYLSGYTLDSAGTQTLRENLESVRKLKPDLVIGAEWDEENENTFFAPTVANGFSTQRITAYYMDAFAGRTPTVFPGDDTDVPNLIVSSRKSLVAGEPLELEIANVPDGTFSGKAFEVSVRWRNAAGETVKEFPVQELSADVCSAVWFRCPASEVIARARTLLPEVTVRWKGFLLGSEMTFSDGFWPVDLNANRVIDFKWVKQPLRELPRGVKAEFSASAPRADGSVRISGRVASPSALRSVEVMEGPDTVWMAGDGREDGRVTVRFSLQAHVCARDKYALNGSIRFTGAPSLRLDVPYSPKGCIARDGESFVFKNFPACNWDAILFADMTAKDAARAEIAYDLKPGFEGRVRVADVLARQVVAAAGPGGMALSFMRFDSVRRQPAPYMKDEVDFSFDYVPGDQLPVLRLQTVDASYRIWRSPAIELGAVAGGERRTIHVYERDLDRVSAVTLPAGRLEEFAYDFRAGEGAVLPNCSRRRNQAGLLGGSVGLVSGIGQGASLYGNLLMRQMKTSEPNWDDSVPRRTHEGLVFTNCTFACFPEQIIPTFAGFSLELMVKPRTFGRRMGVLAGSHASFSLEIGADGVPEAICQFGPYVDFMRPMNRDVKGPALKVGEWNRLRYVFDGTAASLEVNGVKGEERTFTGYEYYSGTFVLGGLVRPLAFFDGEIAAMRIRLR